MAKCLIGNSLLLIPVLTIAEPLGLIKMEKADIIIKLVNSFIKKDKRVRSLHELNNIKKRQKFASRINHGWTDIFDEKLFKPTPNGIHNSEVLINYIPIKKNTDCYIISNFNGEDNEIVSFERALTEFCTGAAGIVIYDFEKNILFIEEEQTKGGPGRFIGRNN